MAATAGIALLFAFSVAATEDTPAAEPAGADVVEAVEAVAAESVTEPALDAPAASLVKATRIAVYELELQGVAPNIGTVVTDSLLAEIRKLQAVSAIGMDEIRDMLSHEANKQIVGCEDSESCLAEIAGALGVDDLISGKLSRVGDSHVITVRRIDQNRAKVSKVYNKRLKAESGQEFLLAVGSAVEELYSDRPLREGAKRGVPKEVALRLNPPPLPPWVFYSAAGAAAGAGAVAGVFQLLANDAESDYNSFAKQGLNAPISGATLVEKEDRANGRVTNARVAIGLASGFAITAAVMYFFTDWEGYGEEQ